MRTPKKTIEVWLTEADLDLTAYTSNGFSLEWPKGSGQVETYPELDRIAYWNAADALRLIVKGQRPLIELAIRRVG